MSYKPTPFKGGKPAPAKVSGKEQVEKSPKFTNKQLVAAITQAGFQIGGTLTDGRKEQAEALLILMSSSEERLAALATAGLTASLALLVKSGIATNADDTQSP